MVVYAHVVADDGDIAWVRDVIAECSALGGCVPVSFGYKARDRPK